LLFSDSRQVSAAKGCYVIDNFGASANTAVTTNQGGKMIATASLQDTSSCTHSLTSSVGTLPGFISALRYIATDSTTFSNKPWYIATSLTFSDDATPTKILNCAFKWITNRDSSAKIFVYGNSNAVNNMNYVTPVYGNSVTNSAGTTVWTKTGYGGNGEDAFPKSNYAWIGDTIAIANAYGKAIKGTKSYTANSATKSTSSCGSVTKSASMTATLSDTTADWTNLINAASDWIRATSDYTKKVPALIGTTVCTGTDCSGKPSVTINLQTTCLC